MSRFSESAKTEGELWSARAADWAGIQEDFIAPCYERVLDVTGVGKGTQVLDVGCGAGGFLRLAAQRGATVSGIDAAPGLVFIARQRTPQGDFRIGDLEQLPYPDDSYDLVTGFNSFQHGSDPVIGLKEAARVAKPGAHVSITVWGNQDRCQLNTVMEAVRTLLPSATPQEDLDEDLHEGPDPKTAEEQKIGHSPGKDALSNLVIEAGLTPMTSEEVDCPMDYPDETTMLKGLMSPAPSAKAILEFGEEVIADAIKKAMAPHRTPSGAYHLENTFLYLIARA